MLYYICIYIHINLSPSSTAAPLQGQRRTARWLHVVQVGNGPGLVYNGESENKMDDMRVSVNWFTQNRWFIRENPTNMMIWRYPYFRKPANLSSYPCYPDGIDGIYGSIKPSIQMQIFAASLGFCSPGFTELTGYSVRGSVGCFWYWLCLEMKCGLQPLKMANCHWGNAGFTVIASRYRSFPSCIPKCIFLYMWNRNIYGELYSNIYIIYMYVMFSHSWENDPQMHFLLFSGGWVGSEIRCYPPLRCRKS